MRTNGVRKDIIQFIRNYQKAHGYPPTHREIARGIGRSLSGLHYVLAGMVLDGLVAKDDRIPRSIRVLR